MLLHVLPQVPQLLLSFEVFRHIPPSQTPYPELQAKVHAPATHAGAALATFVVHTIPHVLQLLLSLAVFTQAPPHRVYPVSHVKPHALDAHVGDALATLVVQTVPQAPQWFTSLVMLTHAVPQSVGVADEQPETHVYMPPSAAELEQRGAPESALHV
jgi:hypothetical protein